MFRPFETLSQNGCQIFSYLEYLLLCFSISYVFEIIDSLFRLFLTRLQALGIFFFGGGGGALPYITYLRYVCSEEVWFLTQVF